MKLYWQDGAAVQAARGIFLLLSAVLAFSIGTNLPYHGGVYWPTFISAVVAALCFAVGRRIGWIQFMVGLIFLLPAITCPNY